jgi:hypothetical protein
MSSISLSTSCAVVLIEESPSKRQRRSMWPFACNAVGEVRAKTDLRSIGGAVLDELRDERSGTRTS